MDNSIDIDNQIKNILDLPNEILEDIFRRIDNHHNLSLVCSRFYEISCNVKFRAITLQEIFDDEEFDLALNGKRRFNYIYLNNKTLKKKHIKRLFALLELNGACIKWLRLWHVWLPTKLSRILNKLPNLTSLVMFRGSVMEETKVNPFLKLKKLKNLRVSIRFNNSCIFDFVNSLPSDVLRKVDFDVHGAGDDLIHDENSFLHNQRKLEVLRIVLKTPASEIDKKFCLLSKFQKLQYFEIYPNGNSVLHCLNKISLPNLTTLTISQLDLNNFPIFTMKTLQQRLPKLESLVFRQCPSNFVNTILEQFQGLKSLKFHSDYSETIYVFQEGLSHENLKSLTIEFTEKTGDISKLLSSCKNLNFLELKMYDGIANEIFEDVFKVLPSLTFLKISRLVCMSSALLDILKAHGKNLEAFSCRCMSTEEGITEDFIRHEFKHQFKITEFSRHFLQLKNQDS